MSDRAKPSIALLAAPETSSSVLYGLYDVLLSVGAVYSDMTTGQPDECLLDVKIVARDDKPFRCFGNVLVEPHSGVDSIEKIDVVIVCDMYSPIDTPLGGRYRREIDWLKQMHAGGSILASVAQAHCCWRKRVCSTGSSVPATGGIETCSANTTRRSDFARIQSSASQARMPES